MEKSRFRLDIRKKVLTVRMVGYWNIFSKEAVDVSSLEKFKARLDLAFNNLAMAGDLG